ncbi:MULTISPECIES: IS5 family transposase [Streptomyces]|uniref:IS5 family transposase n=1 Tax=Streptomyces TaxID=1883 RepID=UPI000995E12C|nr:MULTISPECIES: IS5 family transposase [Streptomyces]
MYLSCAGPGEAKIARPGQQERYGREIPHGRRGARVVDSTGRRSSPPAPQSTANCSSGRPSTRINTASSGSPPCTWSSGWRRWSGGECLGRSRGGFTTKLHLAADGRCRPLALVPTPGHYGDGPQLERVLDHVSVPRTGVGRPRTRPDHVLADKAYTSRKKRRYLRRRGISHTIPERLDQQRHRRNRGSRGGRPTGFDNERYKKRNTVERAVNRLKGFRAVATRYEKRAHIYLGTVTLAALMIWLRT